jgi:hypothetical protein
LFNEKSNLLQTRVALYKMGLHALAFRANQLLIDVGS